MHPSFFVKSTILVLCAGMIFTSCTKKNDEAKAPAELSVVSETEETLLAALDPEEEKLARVLSSMSERAKAAIPNGEPKEFLADLKAVLDAEKTFPQDDLSLYYLIDKKHSVSKDYVPRGMKDVVANDLWNVNKSGLCLRPDVYAALEKMAKAAKADGIKLMVSSTYRSYAYQDRLFNRYVAEDGLALAERYSARPGTSQHQLGTAIDFGTIDDSFAETEMCKWLMAHSEEYGWSLSFPKDYEDVTGFMWECWHFRYVGKEACVFQKKWFGDVQQFMMEFINAWKNDSVSKIG